MKTKIFQNILRAVKHPRQAFERLGVFEYPRFQIREIKIQNVLRSGEALIPSARYSRLVGNPLRSSQRFIHGPHVKLLESFQASGDQIFDEHYFEKCEYYQNAKECISYIGHYFPYVKSRKEIMLVAKSFIQAWKGESPTHHVPSNGHNNPSDLIEVAPIMGSHCFELINGNHRLASAWVNGQKEIKAKVYCEERKTLVQEIITDVLWQNGRFELYQPIDLPELSGWPLVRKCEDRFQMMKKFIENAGSRVSSYLDVGSSYGYFVKRFHEERCNSFGVERDPFAKQVSVKVYQLNAKQIYRSDIESFLYESSRTFDAVSCFSVMHHFALKNASMTPVDLAKLLDKVTGKVLFFDTGQDHENWFAEKLSGWNDDYIEAFFKQNTTFTKAFRLGRDEDNRGKYEGNYGRTLFAFTRG